VNVLDLDFKQCDVVYGWIWMLMSMFLMNIVKSLDLHVDVNECVRFGCVYGCG
jgi:hypothetical protein